MTGTVSDRSDDRSLTGGSGRSPAVDEPDDEAHEAVDHGYVRTNGVDTYYERRGAGPPLVFVHAAIMDHGMWASQVDVLAGEYTVVTYDVRGHGRTNGSYREQYSIELFADDLAVLVAELGLGRPVVCGASMGAAVAQVYAVRYPERLSGLVLVDAWSPAVSNWRDRAQMASLVGAIWPVRIFGIRRVQALMTWAQERFVDPGSRGDYEAVVRVQAEAPAIPPGEFAKVARATAHFVREGHDLASITVPALVLYGEHTVGTVRRHLAIFESRLPDVEVREVPGGGHACNLDNPQFVSGAVGEFVSDRLEGRDDASAP